MNHRRNMVLGIRLEAGDRVIAPTLGWPLRSFRSMIEGGGLFRSFSVDDCVEGPAAISAEWVDMTGGSEGGHVVRSNCSAMLTFL